MKRSEHPQFNTSSIPSSSESESSDSPRSQPIEDDIDEVEFELSIKTMVASIQSEMRTFGELERDEQDLKNVEFSIQSERIMRLMDVCVENVQFGFLLPKMLRDTANPRTVEIAGGMKADEKARLQEMYTILSKNTDVESEHDLYSELESCMRSAEKCGFKSLLPEYANLLPSEGKNFIDSLDEFVEMAKHRIFWTAPKAMAKEKRLYSMWTENQGNSVLVAELRTKIDAAQRGIHRRDAEHESVMAEYQRKVDQLNAEMEDRIEKTVYTSNLKMNRTFMQSALKVNELRNRADRIKEEYDKMLLDNLASGKKLREHKLRVQQKLQSWLLKYDTEVADRCKELFGLKDQLSDESNQFRKWMLKFDEQEIVYEDVQAQILAAWILERDEKVRIFTMHYAAKIVQRAFRKLLKNRKRRRKGKKGKK